MFRPLHLAVVTGTLAIAAGTLSGCGANATQLSNLLNTALQNAQNGQYAQGAATLYGTAATASGTANPQTGAPAGNGRTAFDPQGGAATSQQPGYGNQAGPGANAPQGGQFPPSRGDHDGPQGLPQPRGGMGQGMARGGVGTQNAYPGAQGGYSGAGGNGAPNAPTGTPASQQAGY